MKWESSVYKYFEGYAVPIIVPILQWVTFVFFVFAFGTL